MWLGQVLKIRDNNPINVRYLDKYITCGATIIHPALILSFLSTTRGSGDVLSHDTVTPVLVLLKIDLFSCDEIEFPSDVESLFMGME